MVARTLKQRIEENLGYALFGVVVVVAGASGSAGVWVGNQMVKAEQAKAEARVTKAENDASLAIFKKDQELSTALTQKEREKAEALSQQQETYRISLNGQTAVIAELERKLGEAEGRLQAVSRNASMIEGSCGTSPDCRELYLRDRGQAFEDTPADQLADHPDYVSLFEGRLLATKNLPGLHFRMMEPGQAERFFFDPDFAPDDSTLPDLPEPEYSWQFGPSEEMPEEVGLRRSGVMVSAFLHQPGTDEVLRDPTWAAFVSILDAKVNAPSFRNGTLRMLGIERKGDIIFAHFRSGKFRPQARQVTAPIDTGQQVAVGAVTTPQKLFLHEMIFVIGNRRGGGVIVLRCRFTSEPDPVGGRRDRFRESAEWTALTDWWRELRIDL